MTGTVPVERAITDGYGFLFHNFFSLLGTVWLPYLVFLILSAGLVWLITPDLPRMLMAQEFDVPFVMRLVRLGLLVAVLGFITGCMVTVGVQRKAQGLHPRPIWYYFSLGGQVWRLAGALFLAAIAIFVISLVTAGVCMAIWYGAGWLGGAARLMRVLDVCAAAAFLMYVMVRLLFFLPAVVVAEGVIGLERAWILGGHNFWRILIVSIAVLAPVFIVFHFLVAALLGPAANLPMGPGVTPREVLRAIVLNYGAVGPFVIVLQILERILFLGAMNGAVASAYLAVSGSRPDAGAPAA